MKVDIPITNLEFRELILILKKYPKGIVKVKDKQAVWETELDLNDSSTPSYPGQQPQSNKLTGKGNVFSNMANSITESFAI